jgi:hypothetical protein
LSSTDANSKNSIPSSAGVFGVVGSAAAGELKSMGVRGMCNDLRFAMKDEEESEKLWVER